jgi:hypothetical protein
LTLAIRFILSFMYGRNHFWQQNVTCTAFRD